MQIRPATAADAEAIERIRVGAWRVAYRHVFPPDELDAMPVDWSFWREQIDNPEWEQRCLVAEADGAVVGWVTIAPSGSGEGEVRGIYVDPDAWRLGAGRALIARAEAELAHTWEEAMLWVIEDNPAARAFYESVGWHTRGERGVFDRFGVSVPLVCYRKRLSSSTSRS